MPCSAKFPITLQAEIVATETSDFLKQLPLKILKFGTLQTIAIIVLKIGKFDVTFH